MLELWMLNVQQTLTLKSADTEERTLTKTKCVTKCIVPTIKHGRDTP